MVHNNCIVLFLYLNKQNYLKTPPEELKFVYNNTYHNSLIFTNFLFHENGEYVIQIFTPLKRKIPNQAITWM